MDTAQFMQLVDKSGFNPPMLEKDYMLTKFLKELGDSPIKKDLVFKGGTALNKLYLGYYRLSEDIDFTAIDADFETIKIEIYKIKNRLSMKLKDGILSRINFTNIFEFRGPLNYPNTLKVDISFTEKPMLELINLPVKHFYDFPNFSIQTMQLKELLSEKIRSMIQRKEPRDYFDVWYICKNKSEILKNIKSLIIKKCEKINVNPEFDKIFRNIEITEKLWDQRLGNIMNNVPCFKKVFDDLKNYMEIIM